MSWCLFTDAAGIAILIRHARSLAFRSLGSISGFQCLRAIACATSVGDENSPHLSILPPLDFDWKAEIDQSCLKERQREHITRMRVERMIELIAAALPELEMRAVTPPAEVWARVDPFEQAIRLRGGARYAVVVHLPPSS